MEQNQNTSLFGLSVDPMSKNHLAEAARWARFLAIVGFVVCGLVVLAGIFAGSIFSSLSSRRYGGFDANPDVTSAMGGAMAVVYILVALLYFFPCLFLFNFATKMKTALDSQNQDVINSSFQNLKKFFRYMGVLTIIVLAIYAMIFIGLLVGSA